MFLIVVSGRRCSIQPQLRESELGAKGDSMDYQQLKQRHRAERENYHTNLSLRVHRSLSWLQRAEQAEDPDGRFIFLWIAFNAAYATEIDDEYRTSEKLSFGSFLEKLSGLDSNRQLEQLTWTEFPKSIRVLLNNRYVFQGFWDFHNGKITQDDWENQFEKAKIAAQAALGRTGYAHGIGHCLAPDLYASQSVDSWGCYLEQFRKPGSGTRLCGTYGKAGACYSHDHDG